MKYTKRKDMQAKLDAASLKNIPHICIPSYSRPNFEFTKRIIPLLDSAVLRNRVYVFVRESQFDEYYEAHPALNFVIIPEGMVDGVGSTRNFILKYALGQGWKTIMDLDDDIIYVQYLYHKKSPKSGQIYSAHSTVADWGVDPKIPQKIFALIGEISQEIFSEHPKAVLGNIRRQRFSTHFDYAETKYMINKGPTPRQTKIINVEAAYNNKLLVPKAFNLHGDDIGYAAHVLQRGLNCFNIPCLCYHYADEKVNSVVRDPNDDEGNRWLHQLEYDALQNMEIKAYLRESFKYPDGQYKFGDIDWRKFHKLHGTEAIIERW